MENMSHNSPASGPLKGIRVLDFGTFVAGSYNAVLMGDLGADVIKVERLEGDPARQVGPFLGDESRIFMGWNRNKRGLAVDLHSEAGLEVVYELVRRTDVVTGNFRPGIAEKLKVDYATLSALNSRLIFSATTGYGPVGPMSARPSYDAVFQAMGGVAHINKRTTGKIAVAAPIFIDIHTAMLALTGVLAALFHRERTGEGQKVETSLLQGVMSSQPSAFCKALEMEEERALGACPYALFETSDGMIFIAVAQDKFWRFFCQALERPEWIDDVRYRSNADRMDNAEGLAVEIQQILITRSNAEWDALLEEKGVPCGVVCTHDEFLHHPQVEAAGMNPVITHSTVGPVRVFGVPVCFEKSPGAIQRSAPTLGEHTEEILEEIGYAPTRIEELLREGVVQTTGDH